MRQKKEEEARFEDITDAPKESSTAVAPAASSSSEEKTEGEADDKGEGTGIAPVQNGAVHDKYRWTQTLGDLAVMVPVPAGTKAKSLVIDIKKKSLLVKVAGMAEPVLDGEMFAAVKMEDCFWSVEDDAKSGGRLVSVTLTKMNQMAVEMLSNASASSSSSSLSA